MSRPTARRMTIVEGLWYKGQHVSVCDLIARLFDLYEKGRPCYHYVPFLDSESWKQACSYVLANGMPKLVYVAAHGSPKGIAPFGDNNVTRTLLANALGATKVTTKKQLYFGSCSFCNNGNAQFILNKCPLLEWVAGYGKDVDWAESTAFDILFMRNLLHPATKRGPKVATKPRKELDLAIETTRKLVGGLGDKLGFHLYRRRKGPGGGLDDLWQASGNG